MKKIAAIVIVHLLLVFLVYPGKLAVFPQLKEVDSLYLDDDQIVIGGNTSVFIYSAKDFKLQAEFGKRGEGPQEFFPIPGRGLWIDVESDKIFIYSLGKISYFKRDGTFIQEKRTSSGSFFFKPFAGQLVGFKNVGDQNIIYETINLFDENFNLLKELFRHESRIQQNSGEIKVLDRSVVIETGRENVFISASNDLEVLVFDKKGTLVYTIKEPVETHRKVNDQDIKEIHEFMKLKYGDTYPFMKNNIKIPSEYPIVRSRIGLEYDYNGGKQRLYVITWNKEGSRNLCLLYDIAGKFLGKVYIDMKSATPILPYPFVIRNGRFYQLVENEETEQWELFVSDIDGVK